MRSLVMATLVASLIICVFLGVSALVRARSKGRFFSLSAVFAGAAIYTAFYIAELTRPDLDGALLCVAFEYVGVAVLTVAMFFMIRDFRGAEPASPWFIALVSIIPAISAAAAFTVRYHEFLYIAPRVSTVQGLTILGFGKGPWYWVNIFYIYGVFAFGFVSFAMAGISGRGEKRAQAVYMLVGSCAPFIASFVYLIGLAPAHADPTPLSFTLAGALYTAGFFRHRLFDIHPIARDMVFEHMREAAIVVGRDGLILDHNRAARAIFPVLEAAPGSLPFSALYDNCPGLQAAFERGDRDTVTVQTLDSGERRFETQHSAVSDKRDGEIGALYLLHDVTERESLQERLRELASLDELTRVSNRRKFYEQAGIELDRANRHGRPIGFAIMDMNGFKEINDRFGHRAGDDALRLTARLCSDALRSCDVMGRIGGDEFAFIFPECDEAGAAAAADKMRKVVGSATFSSGASTVLLSAAFGSVGSAGPRHPDLEEFLSVADRRMYADKPGAKAAPAKTGARAAK